MKKLISLFLVFIMVFSFASCNFNKAGDITGYSNNADIINRTLRSFTVDDNGDFVILQITDTHLISGTTKKDLKTLEAIKTEITDIKPDLVVVSGDMIEGNTTNQKYNKKAALEAIASLFEGLNQYWAYVPGNNDGEYKGSTEDVVAFLSDYKYCMMSDEANLTGATQYIIKLNINDGAVVHALVFMDSLARDSENNYDYMKDDQVQWLKEKLDEIKTDTPNVKVSLFFHMNTPDFAVAGKNGSAYNDYYNTIPNDFYDGIKGNEAIDEVIENSGCVGLVSIGHIHPKTNYCSFYNNTYYHITRATGYYATKHPGCSVITIHTSAENTKAMYDFKEIAF